MNNRGEVNNPIGILIAIAVAIIVGAILLTPIAQNVGTTTNLGQATNSSYTMPANGTTTDLTLCGQLNTSAITINNYTNSAGVAGNGGAGNASMAGNFTITQAQGTNGYLATRIRWDSLGDAYVKAGYLANVTCTFQPPGYITDGGGRSITSLITILAALALLVAAMIPTIRQKILGE